VHPVKPDKSEAELFAEFLRWREAQKLTGAR
jgi:hypothetical protein